MGRKPCLTVEEKQEIVAGLGAGESVYAVSRSLERSPHTVARYAGSEEGVAKIKEIQERLAEKFENLAERMLDSIDSADITKINALQRTTAAAIGTDKARLLRNQSTDNLDIHVLLREGETLDQKIAELENKLEGL